MTDTKEKPKLNFSPLDAYRKTEVMTANRETLLLMLYAGALRFLKSAIAAVERKDIQEKNRLLIKTQEIISELRSTLNFEIGGELAKRLDSLYSFITRRLLQGQMEANIQPLREALGVLETLNEAWEKAITSLKSADAKVKE